MIVNMTGQIVRLESVLLLLPFVVSIIYGESRCIFAYIVTAVISFICGSLMILYSNTKNKVIYAPEGFIITALSWVSLSLIGALPFVISGDIPSYTDAFFETVSGFTTTGASILTDVEAMSHANLFWRSFTHWIGGMGVLVLIVAILPPSSTRSIHILKAEMPGPTMGKLVPKLRSTAVILYVIYMSLTVVQIVFLVAGGMDFFDSILHAFGTAGTGGFGIKSDSVGGYSPYLQWVIAIFMLIFGVNFNVYYLILTKKFKSILHNQELWAYLGIVLGSVIMITANIYSRYDNLSDSLRHASFQVSSIITTTGYSTADFDLWPDFSKNILFILMFIGGCAGSTAGGLKVSRVVLLFKLVKRSFKSMLHPRSVGVIKMEDRSVDDATLQSVGIYFALYMFCLAIIIILLGLEPFSFETNISAAVSCFNNVGPGFSSVGPMYSYAGYSDGATWLLSIAMLLGRLEIYPILLASSFLFSRNKNKL